MVKYLDARCHGSALTVPLKRFSAAESSLLLTLKLKSSRQNYSHSLLACATSRVKRFLGNLPLCVSIYSSMLVRSLKQQRKGSPHGLENLHGADLVSSWAQIEEDFGDRHHIRGLTGVVQTAKYYLQDRPMAVLLLAKICLCSAESTLWEILNRAPKKKDLQIFMRTQTSRRSELVKKIQGICDWLFSGNSEDTLTTCRNELEEVGLISWEPSTSAVHIHRLKLFSMSRMLEENDLFLITL